MPPCPACGMNGCHKPFHLTCGEAQLLVAAYRIFYKDNLSLPDVEYKSRLDIAAELCGSFGRYINQQYLDDCLRWFEDIKEREFTICDVVRAVEAWQLDDQRMIYLKRVFEAGYCVVKKPSEHADVRKFTPPPTYTAQTKPFENVERSMNIMEFKRGPTRQSSWSVRNIDLLEVLEFDHKWQLHDPEIKPQYEDYINEERFALWRRKVLGSTRMRTRAELREDLREQRQRTARDGGPPIPATTNGAPGGSLVPLPQPPPSIPQPASEEEDADESDHEVRIPQKSGGSADNPWPISSDEEDEGEVEGERGEAEGVMEGGEAVAAMEGPEPVPTQAESAEEGKDMGGGKKRRELGNEAPSEQDLEIARILLSLRQG